MREILFKAKRVDSQEWVEGYYSKIPSPNIVFINQNEIDCHEVDPVTVCFASSRADENKVKIFSDDMVEFTVFDHNGADTQHTGIVKWTGDKFIIVKSEEDPYFGSDGPFDLDWVCDQDDTIMVVGSI